LVNALAKAFSAAHVSSFMVVGFGAPRTYTLPLREVGSVAVYYSEARRWCGLGVSCDQAGQPARTSASQP
jgi:hypothetical protein